MRLLLDENIPGHTEDVLRSLGHDVLRPPSRASDAAVVMLAQRRRALLVTRDRDFLTILPSTHAGLIVVRIHPSIAEHISQALSALLQVKPARWLRGKILILRRDGYEIVR